MQMFKIQYTQKSGTMPARRLGDRHFKARDSEAAMRECVAIAEPNPYPGKATGFTLFDGWNPLAEHSFEQDV